MIHVVSMTFNPFQENTYLVYDETKSCIIFDPGCYTAPEKKMLADQIEQLKLNPVRLINTHCHIDHVFGNHFVAEKYGLELEIHPGEEQVLNIVPQVAQMYNIPLIDPMVSASKFIEEGDEVHFGNSTLKAILTPGHSPASLSFFSESANFLIAGDVLFYESIGRYDLPGGDYPTLVRSIKEKLFPLGDEVKVYPGHGVPTTIGHEKVHNPFID